MNESDYIPAVKTIPGSIQHDFLQAGFNAWFEGKNLYFAWLEFCRDEMISCMGISEPGDMDHDYFFGLFHAGYTVEAPRVYTHVYGEKPYWDPLNSPW